MKAWLGVEKMGLVIKDAILPILPHYWISFLGETEPHANFLRPAFTRFFNDDNINFFHVIGV